VQTVQPYAETTDRTLDLRAELSEEEADAAAIANLVGHVIDSGQGAVLCTHRPVLPAVYDALDLRERHRADDLAPAEALVVHLRKGHDVAVERHLP
jgi:8-oxo-(d)GTP phosphatase